MAVSPHFMKGSGPRDSGGTTLHAESPLDTRKALTTTSHALRGPLARPGLPPGTQGSQSLVKPACSVGNGEQVTAPEHGAHRQQMLVAPAILLKTNRGSVYVNSLETTSMFALPQAKRTLQFIAVMPAGGTRLLHLPSEPTVSVHARESFLVNDTISLEGGYLVMERLPVQQDGKSV